MSGVVHAAATVPPGALGRDGVPGGEALAGPGAGDYVLVRHERYTKIAFFVFIFFLEHSISPSYFLLSLSSSFFFVIFVVCFLFFFKGHYLAMSENPFRKYPKTKKNRNNIQLMCLIHRIRIYILI